MAATGKSHALIRGAIGLPAERIVVFGVSITAVPVVALSLVTFLHMALGEQAPKSLAIRAPKVLVLLTAPPLVILSYVFSPVIWLLNTVTVHTTPAGRLLVGSSVKVVAGLVVVRL